MQKYMKGNYSLNPWAGAEQEQIPLVLTGRCCIGLAHVLNTVTIVTSCAFFFQIPVFTEQSLARCLAVYQILTCSQLAWSFQGGVEILAECSELTSCSHGQVLAKTKQPHKGMKPLRPPGLLYQPPAAGKQKSLLQISLFFFKVKENKFTTVI